MIFNLPYYNGYWQNSKVKFNLSDDLNKWYSEAELESNIYEGEFKVIIS